MFKPKLPDRVSRIHHARINYRRFASTDRGTASERQSKKRWQRAFLELRKCTRLRQVTQWNKTVDRRSLCLHQPRNLSSAVIFICLYLLSHANLMTCRCLACKIRQDPNQIQANEENRFAYSPAEPNSSVHSLGV
jgi:hypothetical protein